MAKIRVLFQGDSITDAGRDRRNYFNLGAGYPKYAAELIKEANPDKELEFINLGISGNRTGQLFDRLYHDAIALQPDVISILIGVNDIWHRYNWDMVTTTDEQIELNYRCILERLKKDTNAKILILSPFVLDSEDKAQLKEDLKTVHPIVRKLADKYADAYIDLEALFDEAIKTQPEPKFYSGDGVHPNANGSQLIAKHYAEAIKSLL